MKPINIKDVNKYLLLLKDLSKYKGSPNLSTSSRRLGYGGSTKPFRKYWDKLIEKGIITKKNKLFVLSNKYGWLDTIQKEGFSDLIESKKIRNTQIKNLTQNQIDASHKFINNIEQESYNKGFVDGIQYALNEKLKNPNFSVKSLISTKKKAKKR